MNGSAPLWRGGSGRKKRLSGVGLRSVPVHFAALALLKEGPYEGVDDVGLVLLEPVTGPRDDVEAEVVADVDAAGLGHLLLQEGVTLPPQQQHWRLHIIVSERQEADDEKIVKKCTKVQQSKYI